MVLPGFVVFCAKLLLLFDKSLGGLAARPVLGHDAHRFHNAVAQIYSHQHGAGCDLPAKGKVCADKKDAELEDQTAKIAHRH